MLDAVGLRLVGEGAQLGDLLVHSLRQFEPSHAVSDLRLDIL
jgi:hypothetical protein